MIIVDKEDKTDRLELINRIIIALKTYWSSNMELEFKDIIEMIRVELDIEEISQISDDIIEKFLIDSIENED